MHKQEDSFLYGMEPGVGRKRRVGLTLTHQSHFGIEFQAVQES
jgi:hypothetical protein